jgi:hypothetical protein
MSKIMQMIRPTKKDEETREAELNAYLKLLLRTSANRIDVFLKFLRDGPDALRQQELNRLEKTFGSKGDIFNQYQKLDVIHRGTFKKTYSVSN